MKMHLLAFIATASVSLSVSAAPSGDAHGEGHGAGKAHRDNTALFPQPKPDFALSTPPQKTEIVEPAYDAKIAGDAVKLAWKDSPGANAYHVQVATDPDFKWLKVDDHWVKGTSFEPKGLEKGHTYFWRVAPWKDDNMAATNKGPFTRSTFILE